MFFKVPFVKFVTNNVYVFIGILIGLYVSSLLSDQFDTPCVQPQVPRPLPKAAPLVKPNPVKHVPSIPPKKSGGKLVRPRYYSTELGIREKLFVGILTSEEKVNTQAAHVNKTIGHLVDKIKFFITAKYKLKTKFNLTGLVGFTDTRNKYRPFQVLKYIGDNFAQDYDYYFLAHDYTFVNAHKLNDVVGKISVSMDVYMGKRVADGSYCDLDAGIVLSNSVLKAVREHLDWCVINGISEDHSENIGRCIHHSIGLSCQESVQGQSIDSFKIKHFDLREHLVELTKKNEFNKAVTVYPVLQSDSFYLLNAYFLRRRLSWIKKEIDVLAEDLTEVWPPGQRPGAKPATRFDLPRQYYFNMTHMFFPDDFTNIRTHTDADLRDIENVIDEVKLKVAHQEPGKFHFRRLINGYKTFDLSRGMDYILDLGFRDLTSGKEVLKRFEVCKPLGKVEFVPVPYVTENTRVTIVFPVQEWEVPQAVAFLNDYSSSILIRKEKTFLMLVPLYQYNSTNKGAQDVFFELKNTATKISEKYKNDDVRIAWVSVRLPQVTTPLTMDDNEALNFAIVDLALRKIGLESLVLVLDVYSNITSDFLNRVRMNTIPGFQVFSPIPFRQYDPKISQFPHFEVNKNAGHFDREEYKYISFYSRDYVNARRKFQAHVPIIKVDNDIVNILHEDYKRKGNLFEMFLKHGAGVHCMRATEMGLKIKHHEEPVDTGRCNLFLGGELQLAKMLLTKREHIPELQ